MSNNIKQLKCDYLIIGGGATGISFVDELLHASHDTTAILVDKRDQPGGHWVEAYPFVRLHQPAAWYGVNSKPLGKGGEDLASKSEILAYYKKVIEDLKLSERFEYFPQCAYIEDGKFKSLLDKTIVYQVKFKILNTLYNI